MTKMVNEKFGKLTPELQNYYFAILDTYEYTKFIDACCANVSEDIQTYKAMIINNMRYELNNEEYKYVRDALCERIKSIFENSEEFIKGF